MEHVGSLLRHWRRRRRMSQLQLAMGAEVSTRHLSCLETDKARPSREMVLVLASALDVPLRERNVLLAAAGHAPAYRETDWDAPRLTPVRQALSFLLRQQEPYGAVVVDRRWDVVDANEGLRTLGRVLTGSGELPENVLRFTLFAASCPNRSPPTRGIHTPSSRSPSCRVPFAWTSSRRSPPSARHRT